MTFGDFAESGINSIESKKVYDLYREKGGNFFDTANAYQGGLSEKLLGEYISSCRSECVIATKYTAHPNFLAIGKGTQKQTNPNAGGNHKKSMVESLDDSLKRLNVGAVELFYVHVWEYSTPIEVVMRGLDDVVRSGKAYHVAVSDSPAFVVSRANTLAELRGWSPFVALQTRYSLIERSFEGELARMADSLNLATIPWGILGEGFLTGKHSTPAGIDAASGRKESVNRHVSNPKNLEILEEVKKIAAETNSTPAQVSLNWITQRTTSPLIGAKTVQQLEDNLGSLNVTLTADHLSRLDKVSAPSLPFPFGMEPMVSRFIDAGAKVPKRRFSPFL